MPLLISDGVPLLAGTDHCRAVLLTPFWKASSYDPNSHPIRCLFNSQKKQSHPKLIHFDSHSYSNPTSGGSLPHIDPTKAVRTLIVAGGRITTARSSYFCSKIFKFSDERCQFLECFIDIADRGLSSFDGVKVVFTER